MDYFQDIRYSCIKHFPDGFVSNKVSPSHTCDSLKKKEFRKSFTSMSDLQKRLNEIGGFATLRKTKTMDAELSRKVQSDHISRKLQGTSKIARKLQKYDNLSYSSYLFVTPALRFSITSKGNIFSRKFLDYDPVTSF